MTHDVVCFVNWRVNEQSQWFYVFSHTSQIDTRLNTKIAKQLLKTNFYLFIFIRVTTINQDKSSKKKKANLRECFPKWDGFQ